MTKNVVFKSKQMSNTYLYNLFKEIDVICHNGKDETFQDAQISKLIQIHFLVCGHYLSMSKLNLPYSYIEYKYVYKLLGLFIKNGCTVTCHDIYNIAYSHFQFDAPMKGLIFVLGCIDKFMLRDLLDELIVDIFSMTGVSCTKYHVILLLLYVVEIIDKDFKLSPKAIKRYMTYHILNVYKYNISAVSAKIIPKYMWKECFIDAIKSSKCEKIISIDEWIKL